MTSEIRELSISENQTADLAAENADDDPQNLYGRDQIHIMGKIIAWLFAKLNYLPPIPQNIVSNAQPIKF